ncbi:hypothetical protein [uncultured Erythrobacter sp.]|uniref:hypothetical protein n=1 Tax=uncultured Erythrobacter sp. TaxID=263913 RepID=UPI002618D57D|nr:hypothetical protein [uncultured Erythrobacter sp.]
MAALRGQEPWKYEERSAINTAHELGVDAVLDGRTYYSSPRYIVVVGNRSDNVWSGPGDAPGLSDHPILDPGGNAGGFNLPFDLETNPAEGTVEVSAEVDDGLSVSGEIDLDGFSLENVELSFAKDGNTFSVNLDVSSLNFGFDTQFDLGGGIMLSASLLLNNDGTFDNPKVIFTVQF